MSPKNGILQAVKHVFLWCIVYEQHVVSMSVRNVEKKMFRFLWKIGLLGLFGLKCGFFMQNV
jgi:hypothetical protein